MLPQVQYPFTSALRDRMAANLAGFERVAIASDDLRAAAVAIILAADERGRASYMVTRRAATLRSHAGQLACPGGRVDAGESAVEAALRETAEEVNLHLDSSAVLGVLDDYATRSGYVMTPVVVWADDLSAMRPNPAEVARVFFVPLASLGRDTVPRLIDIPESDQPVLQVPIGPDNYLNTPTAALVWQMFEVGVRGRSTRVAHYEQPVWAWR